MFQSLSLINSIMATADIRVEVDGIMFGLAEKPDRFAVTGSTARVSSLPVLAHKSGMTPVVRVGGQPSGEEGTFN